MTIAKNTAINTTAIDIDIDMDIDIDAQLIDAAASGHAEVVESLLAAGADIHAMDVDDLVLMDAVVKILTDWEEANK